MITPGAGSNIPKNTQWEKFKSGAAKIREKMPSLPKAVKNFRGLKRVGVTKPPAAVARKETVSTRSVAQSEWSRGVPSRKEPQLRDGESVKLLEARLGELNKTIEEAAVGLKDIQKAIKNPDLPSEDRANLEKAHKELSDIHTNKVAESRVLDAEIGEFYKQQHEQKEHKKVAQFQELKSRSDQNIDAIGKKVDLLAGKRINPLAQRLSRLGGKSSLNQLRNLTNQVNELAGEIGKEKERVGAATSDMQGLLRRHVELRLDPHLNVLTDINGSIKNTIQPRVDQYMARCSKLQEKLTALVLEDPLNPKAIQAQIKALRAEVKAFAPYEEVFSDVATEDDTKRLLDIQRDLNAYEGIVLSADSFIKEKKLIPADGSSTEKTRANFFNEIKGLNNHINALIKADQEEINSIAAKSSKFNEELTKEDEDYNKGSHQERRETASFSRAKRDAIKTKRKDFDEKESPRLQFLSKRIAALESKKTELQNALLNQAVKSGILNYGSLLEHAEPLQEAREFILRKQFKNEPFSKEDLVNLSEKRQLVNDIMLSMEVLEERGQIDNQSQSELKGLLSQFSSALKSAEQLNSLNS